MLTKGLTMWLVIPIILSLTNFLIGASSLEQQGGTPWSEDETLVIYKKVYKLLQKPNKVIKEYLALHPEAPNYHTKTRPNAPKILRLAFHDCIPYADQVPSGCDGCLNPSGMMTDMIKKYNTGKNKFNGPDVNATNNNGLLFTADILEEIYTNPNFPARVQALNESMKSSGKSRADLWAFSALIAAQFGIKNNNKACLGKSVQKTCGHVYSLESDCALNLSSDILNFKTGRMDCIANDALERPFFTMKHEIHPNAQGNGPTTVDYFQNHFNLTAREAIVLIEGAHSFGKLNRHVSMNIYAWTRKQTLILNNQMFRHLVSKPQYFLDCEPNLTLVGNATNDPGQTTWAVEALGMSENRGPFLWIHMYNRCPSSIDCQGKHPPNCCENLQCNLDCQQWIEQDESALPVDTGLFFKFNADPVTGLPSGCPGFNAKWLQGKKEFVYPNCPLETYAPQGESLHEIVQDYAQNNQKWMDDFFQALHKMSTNGYSQSELIVNNLKIN